MLKQLLFCFLIFLTFSAFSQTTKTNVSITVLGEGKAPLEGATAELLRVKDSAIVKTAITDNTGLAEFEKVSPGKFLVRVTSVNYSTYFSEPFEVGTERVTIPPASLTMKTEAALKEVTVVTRKPFIQKLTDRIVVNVENSIVNAGSTAMEVLERSPGVSVDQNDNISLRGRAGVVIMIDGRITPMTGASLASYLKGLPSNAIERIDLITNPSSKYDAAGNSGIIDIRMKKDQRLGLNGTFNAGYGQGVYPKANAGTTFNYRNKVVNIFGNYNYSYRKGLNHLLLERNFFSNSNYDGGDEKDNYMTAPSNNNTARFGADFFAGKKTILGFVVNSSFNDIGRTNHNSAVVMNNVKQAASTFNTDISSHDKFNNSVINANIKHTFDKTGRELTADADYGVFNNRSISSTLTRYYFLNGTSQKPTYILNGDQDGKLTIKTAKADYVNPLKKDGRIEAGIKTSVVSSGNDAKFFDVSSGRPVNDTTKTNHFNYDESNNAAYINFSQQFKKFSLQFGLRGEQTNIKTKQVKGNVSWDSSYFQLFPSAFINYKLKPDQTLGVSVSRRIDRPGYNQLNPFLFLIDISTYSTGAPGLLPQFTWSYELSYTLKQLNFTLGYSHTKHIQSTAIIPFKSVFPNVPINDTNVTLQIPVNLTSSDYFGLTIAAPIKVNNWWNIMNNADLYYINYKGNLANTPLNNGSPTARISTNNSFTFKKGWASELNFNYSSRSRSGYMVLEPQWGLSAGVQKSILQNKGTVRFNVTDIFWTNLPRATITYNNYIENWHAYRETRVANLSFTYRFGNNKVAASRRRTTASEEERRRAGGN
ncbi:outer membrane beta-barrel protein [Segetibacter aerophilus]|nr:outer membrane beta-barrel protein [Segetibacter aerophilus]